MLVLLRSTSEERNLNSTREKAGHEQLAKKKKVETRLSQVPETEIRRRP